MLLVSNPHLHDIMNQYSRRINMSTKTPDHDLDHEVYIDPKDHKEHVNHGMKNDGKINDWHTRHEDKHLEVYCDNHPDSLECRVYDD